MKARVEKINGCRVCASHDLVTFLDLGEMPLSDGFTQDQQSAKNAERFPLEVVFCNSCSLVQILHTVAPDILFDEDYPYFSSFSDTLLDHSAENVRQRIEEKQLGEDSLAIEIASNDGYLLRNYQLAGIPHLGIDPAPGPAKVARDAGIDTICGFFSAELANGLADEGKQADIIHANNVLAHVADTNGFVAGLKTLLKPEGTIVIEVPYLRDLIDHGEFDTIYHEHLCYFSVHALDSLFRRHDLYLNQIERLAIHGGSLRLFVEHKESPKSSVLSLMAEERELGLNRLEYFQDFAHRVADIRKELSGLLRGLKEQGKSLAGYGAAAKGTILLNYFGISSDQLDFVADRNTHKQGRWIPGVALEIKAPETIEQLGPDVLLILPWNFKDEIISQQAAHQARGGQFIIPIPKPHLI